MKYYPLYIKQILVNHIVFISFVLVLLINQYFSVTTCYLEVSDDQIIKNAMDNFHMRKYANDRLVLKDFVENCNDRNTLITADLLIKSHLSKSPTEELVTSAYWTTESMPPTSLWQKAFIFFLTVSLAIVIIYNYKFVILYILCPLIELKLNTMESLNLLYAQNPERLYDIIQALHLIDTT
jgi:hypothetical protein